VNLFLKICLLILPATVACNDAVKKEHRSTSLTQMETDLDKLMSLDGQSIDIKKLKGKTIFINFWATWCKPCLEEMPSIQRAREIEKDKDIEFFFVSDESKDEIERFRATHDFDFNYVRAENLSDMNILGLPTTFIFNSEGKLVFSETGYRKWDDKTNIDLILNNSK